MIKFPTLYTDRLVLRKCHISDASSMYDIFSNAAVTEFYDVDTFTHLDQAKNFVDNCIRQYGYWKNNFHDVRMFSLLKHEWKYKPNKLLKNHK